MATVTVCTLCTYCALQLINYSVFVRFFYCFSQTLVHETATPFCTRSKSVYVRFHIFKSMNSSIAYLLNYIKYLERWLSTNTTPVIKRTLQIRFNVMWDFITWHTWQNWMFHWSSLTASIFVFSSLFANNLITAYYMLLFFVLFCHHFDTLSIFNDGGGTVADLLGENLYDMTTMITLNSH